MSQTNSTKISLSINKEKHKNVIVETRQNLADFLRDQGLKGTHIGCEQGACGTCKVNVLKGKVDHQDVYLNSTEKAGGDVIMTCVSRALSDRLILDIYHRPN